MLQILQSFQKDCKHFKNVANVAESTRCCKCCRENLQSYMPLMHMSYCFCCSLAIRDSSLLFYIDTAETLTFGDSGLFCHLDIAIAGVVFLGNVKFLLFIKLIYCRWKIGFFS